MLLYHFPLTKDLKNYGFANLYKDSSLTNATDRLSDNTALLVDGGMVSQKAKGQGNIIGNLHTKSLSTFSFAFRFKADTSYNNITRFLVLNISTTGDVRILYLQRGGDGKIQVCYYNGSSYPAPYKVMADNNWHSWVVNCVNGNLSFYIDNVYLGSLTSDFTTRDYISFGVNGWIASAVQDGSLMQDFRMWDKPLSQAEIKEYSRALVVHYPLQGNELNGSVLKDVSGFGNDSYKNSDSAAEFDYYNDNIRGLKYADDNKINQKLWYTSPKNFYPNFNTTICYWVKFTMASGKSIQIFRTSNNGTYLNGTNKNVYGYIQTSDGNIGNWSGGLTENKWYFIAFTFEQSGSNIITKSYVNGNLYNTRTLAGTISVTEMQLDLLNYNNNASIFSLCDYRVYATALSAEDIKNLYNSPISVSNQHQTMAFEFKENPLYPSKYWRTPTYAEMNYILTQRTNAANLRTLGRVEISSGTYRNGLFLLPDGFTAPSGISMTITTENYSTNTYTLTQLKIIEDAGGIFIPSADRRNGANMQINGIFIIWLATSYNANNSYCLQYNGVSKIITFSTFQRYYGMAVRLCHTAQGQHTFSASTSTSIRFARSNLQYHCTQHKWRFAEHSYDFIGAANANISDTYNGWIDLFGYGTSGVNYSPTLHTTTNSDYASGDIANTDNDWGINEIQSYDYNVKNFAANKNGIVQHNELRENDSEINGCYQDKLITNELIEN